MSDDGPPPLEDMAPVLQRLGKLAAEHVAPVGAEPEIIAPVGADADGAGAGAGSGGAAGASAGTSAASASSDSGAGSGAASGAGGGVGDDDGPSLLSEMLAAAQQAKRENQESERAKALADSSSSFGAGLSGGFFGGGGGGKAKQSGGTTSRTSAPAPVPVRTTLRRCDYGPCSKTEAALKREGGKFSVCGRCKEVRYCSAACQRSHWRSGHKRECGKDPEVIEVKPTRRADADADASPLRLPEVQAAMKRTADGMASKLSDGAWMTPDLFTRLAKNPKLMAALSDPRFNAVLNEMQTNPASAMAKCKSDPEMQELLTAFMQLMGDHFTHLGAKEGETKDGGGKSGKQSAAK